MNLTSRVVNVLKYLFHSIKYHFFKLFKLTRLLRRSKHKKFTQFDYQKISKDAINSLRRDGYFVIPNYLSELQCQKARDTFCDAALCKPELTHHYQDIRLFGAENLIPEAKLFFEDKFLTCVGQHSLSENLFCAFTLANWLVAGDSGSSGGGWHRDAYFGQYKAMLYLSDVDTSNGPFQIVPKTHRILLNLHLIISGYLIFEQDRFTDVSICKILKVLRAVPKAITGKAGTLILFNGSCLHRGSPIEAQERIALTNYYFNKSRSLLSIRRQFWPVVIKTPQYE